MATDFNVLLGAVGRKDKEAFSALFAHFAPRIKSFLIKGGLKPEEADEVAQETMLSVWHKAESFDPARANASTWIFTIARNKKIDALRKGGRVPVADFDTTLLEDESQGPRENMIQAEESAAVAKAFEALPAEQRDLLQRSFFEGKSHAQIAAETGIPLGTIKSRIRLALERLRGQNRIRELRT
jgi:RNA polymerase sigma-70 factor (ECF subfamily)